MKPSTSEHRTLQSTNSDLSMLPHPSETNLSCQTRTFGNEITSDPSMASRGTALYEDIPDDINDQPPAYDAILSARN